MKSKPAAQAKRFTIREETWMGTTVYSVWDTLMERQVLSTMDAQYAQAECNRMN